MKDTHIWWFQYTLRSGRTWMPYALIIACIQVWGSNNYLTDPYKSDKLQVGAQRLRLVFPARCAVTEWIWHVGTLMLSFNSSPPTFCGVGIMLLAFPAVAAPLWDHITRASVCRAYASFFFFPDTNLKKNSFSSWKKFTTCNITVILFLWYIHATVDCCFSFFEETL